MNNKQRKVLEKIFQKPTLSNIKYNEVESLLKSLGVNIDISRKGSNVFFEYNGIIQNIHRPHPQNELKKYAVEAIRDFLNETGVKP